MAIRDSGETNMLDTRTVQWIANRENYFELVIYLEENSREYWNFIMTGEALMADEDEEDYDRGWDVHPTCKAAEVALEILLYEYDGRNEE